MNNEEKILAMLEKMDSRLDKLEAGQAKLEAGQAKLEAGMAKLEAGMTNLEKEVADVKNEISCVRQTQDKHTALLEVTSKILVSMDDILLSDQAIKTLIPVNSAQHD